MTATPRVDVRIPVMGRDTYVAGAIESVLAQTFESWALVVSENGDPDATVAAAIAPYLSDPRVEHVRVGEQLSAAAHHTRLVTRGSAPYVAVLHDDDRWERGALGARVSFLDELPDCCLVFSGARIVDASGRELVNARPALTAGLQPSRPFLAALYAGNFAHVSTALLRRDALVAVDGSFREEFPTFDDHELWFRLALRFPVGFLGESDVRVLKHEAQLSLDRPLHADEHLRLLDRFDELLAADPAAVPARVRRKVRASVTLSCALDAIERGDADRGRRLLERAVREHAATLVHPKAFVAAVGAFGGRPGRRSVHAVRRAVAERRPFR